MTSRIAGWIVALAILSVALAAAADNRAASAGRHPGNRGCLPVVPILSQVLPGDVQDEGIRSCDVLTTPRAWAAFCADNDLACATYDEGFFREWELVAIVIDTVSPVVCENAGDVPRWEVGCLARRGPMIGARVELTLAGSVCQCTMNPQFPVGVFVVGAVPAGGTAACRAWPELHLVECLGP